MNSQCLCKRRQRQEDDAYSVEREEKTQRWGIECIVGRQR